MKTVAELVKTDNVMIVDVRTRAEFAGGHVADSVNIPLDELPERINELKGKENIIVCCRSGARSANAAVILKQNGINCLNGGSWLDVNYYRNN